MAQGSWWLYDRCPPQKRSTLYLHLRVKSDRPRHLYISPICCLDRYKSNWIKSFAHSLFTDYFMHIAHTKVKHFCKWQSDCLHGWYGIYGVKEGRLVLIGFRMYQAKICEIHGIIILYIRQKKVTSLIHAAVNIWLSFFIPSIIVVLTISDKLTH